jgi:hypothetical protein
MTKIMVFLVTILSLLVFTGCAGKTEKPQPQNSNDKLEEHYGSNVQHGIHIRLYPDGTKAEEVVFNNGRKNGTYTAWYKNGQKKLKCQFRNDILDGEVAAWFEDGRKRFSVNLVAGERHDQWIRYREKGGIVTSLNFNHDKLDGFLSAAFEQGHGNGRGMSYAIKAVFQNGVMVESFHLVHTDQYGHTINVDGELLENGSIKIIRQKNVKMANNGTLRVDFGRFNRTYHKLQDFFINEINLHVMTKFALEFCKGSENIWSCQFPHAFVSSR